MARPRLTAYRRKRDFDITAEPSGAEAAPVKPADQRRYIIQKHAATRLHYDLRLEVGGVFRSWAVTRGPSLDPDDKRLAVEVEDHPLAYGDFEGTIPKGQYGGGSVQLWDRGYWAPEAGYQDAEKALEDGHLKFVMEGERLHGGWALVRMKDDGPRAKRHNWLLIKHRDPAAAGAKAAKALLDDDRSVSSGRSMHEIAKGTGARPTPFIMARAGAPDAVWNSKPAGAAAQRAAPAKPKRSPPAMDALPAFVEPQLCKTTDRPPVGAGWIHEIKFDGYRMQLRVAGGRARLRTRKGLDWTDRFGDLADIAGSLPDCLVDGEVCALDHEGQPDFAALQAAIAAEDSTGLIFFAFDLLAADGEDLRPLPLSERKARLKALLAKTDPVRIRFVDHFESAGKAVLESACRLDLEGIVSKRLDAPYRSGRSETWTKTKCRAGHEVVLGAWTTTDGRFRSLIAGVYRGGALIHVGRIGTGFGQAVVDRLLPKLKANEADASPFAEANAPRKAAGVHWLKPVLVAEIEYAGFTADGAIRQASFKGLREDKPAREVEAEAPADPAGIALEQPALEQPALAKAAAAKPTAAKPAKGAAARDNRVLGVTLSHPEKPLWPDGADGAPVTKLDLARYFEAVAPRMLPHIQGRPSSFVRIPNGIDGERFFQRHAMRGASNLITQVKVAGDRQPYLQVDSAEALVAAAQIAAVELHPWNCRPDESERPGRLVFDFDPAPDVGFDVVVEAAREMRDRLDTLGLVSFCKTTGGKGLHVVTHLSDADLDWPTAKGFARAVCEAVAADRPDRFVVNMAKAKRVGRIFLDYLRNDRTATAVAPYSPRARPGATVSTPLRWTQVRAGLDPTRYTVRSVPALLSEGDPWTDWDEAARPLARAIERLGAGTAGKTKARARG